MPSESISRTCVEIAPVQIAIGARAAHQSEQIVFCKFLARRRRDDLLRQNIQRSFGNLQPVQLARANRAHQRRALDQFVARGGEEAAFGQRAHPVPRPADALQRDRDRTRRADLAHQIHRADIDSQLQRRGRHHGPQLAILQALLGLEPQRARKAAVMRQHRVLAQPLAQMVRDAFGQPARVDEDQRGAMLLRQRGDAVVNLVPHLRAGDRAQLVARNFHCQIHGAAMADLHDLRAGRSGIARLLRSG